MYIIQTAACVMPSMSHCEYTGVGVGGEVLQCDPLSVTHLIVFWLPHREHAASGALTCPTGLSMWSTLALKLM